MDRKPAERPNNQDARVLKFRPRGTLFARPLPRPSPVEDLRRYETDSGPDDFRHRMIMNAAGLAATLLLIIIGVWIANTMAQLRKDQDCVLAGRRDCAMLKTTVLPSSGF